MVGSAKAALRGRRQEHSHNQRLEPGATQSEGLRSMP